MGMLLLRHLIDNGREIALTPRDLLKQRKGRGEEGSRSALFTVAQLIPMGLETTFPDFKLAHF